ncbi:hypothetical protein DICVIV_11461 [Dictyocaulus viviparus]|uniref:Uncharacterized protein n=1 Tax=Dictyocaulus viviparus TaxID=29172 RepID=A0A0D8XD46_DICVI|nr:hypothetical protein DICVIV_11461 [Dictyocaulus viviparus]
MHAWRTWKEALKMGWTKIKTGNLNGHRVCMPPPFNQLISQVEEKRLTGHKIEKIERSLHNNYIALKFLYDSTSNKDVGTEFLIRNRRYVKRIDKRHIDIDALSEDSELTNSWTSNMFVIVDQRTQTSIAYVGTLGRTFGSRVHTGDNFYLNNLQQIKQKISWQSDNGFHRLLPSILFQPEQITFAYAATGGSIAYSKSGPRTISVMLLNKLDNITIDEAVIYPIIYPAGTSDDLAFKEGVPFIESLHLNRIVLSAGQTSDESVAITAEGDSLAAVHKDLNNRIGNIPAGI